MSEGSYLIAGTAGRHGRNVGVRWAQLVWGTGCVKVVRVVPDQDVDLLGTLAMSKSGTRTMGHPVWMVALYRHTRSSICLGNLSSTVKRQGYGRSDVIVDCFLDAESTTLVTSPMHVCDAKPSPLSSCNPSSPHHTSTLKRRVPRTPCMYMYMQHHGARSRCKIKHCHRPASHSCLCASARFRSYYFVEQAWSSYSSHAHARDPQS